MYRCRLCMGRRGLATLDQRRTARQTPPHGAAAPGTPTPPTLIFCCLPLPPLSAQLLSFSMRNQRTYSAFYVTKWNLKLKHTSTSIFYFCNVLCIYGQSAKQKCFASPNNDHLLIHFISGGFMDIYNNITIALTSQS